jgi:MFS transporter, PPP family, 3-phenylpropionic acid transporter
MHRGRSTLSTFVAVYALLYGAFGVQSPFLPALLRERGLHADEIGLVLGASTAVRMFAGPAIGQMADRTRLHTLTLLICAMLAAIAGLGYVSLSGFKLLLLAALMQAVTLAPIVPLSDALATTAANQSLSAKIRQFDYGWVRASGSAAFVIGTTLSGWVLGKTDLTVLPWLSGAVLAIGGATALALPGLPIAASASIIRGTILRDWVLLLRITTYRRMLIIAALIEGSHALQDTFAVIRWRAAAVDPLIVSLLWSEAVVSEVAVFLAIGPRLVNQFGPGWCCMLAAVAGAFRWTISAFTTSPIVMGFTQPLHGLTFALLHLACMRLIVQTVPVRLAATAQSAYVTLSVGFGVTLLTLVSGILYEDMGGHAFLIMAACCFLALPMCAGLHMSVNDRMS